MIGVDKKVAAIFFMGKKKKVAAAFFTV